MVARDVNWFPVALVVSLAVNTGLWTTLSIGASQVASHKEPPLIQVERIVIDDKGKKEVKVIKPEEIKKKVEKVVKEPPKPEPKPIVHTKLTPPPPQGAHNKVITAAPSKTGEPQPQDFSVKAGGNAAVGAPIAHQEEGNATTNPPVIQPQPQPTPPAPQPQPQPQPTPPAPQPEPKPQPPAPKGPTMDAQPADQVQPSIPDSLKTEDLKTFVRVRVEVAEDGSANVVLRTSSGNPDVDKLILDALKKWKWKPALQEGVPVKSTQLFKFEIEIN